MSDDPALLDDAAEDLFEHAPCAYLSTDLDGTILKVNRTFERWTGYTREELLGRRRFAQLLTAGGRIYHETHYAPLLRMQGQVREIALEVVRADGSRLPVLVNSTLRHDGEGRPRVIRTTIFDASDRRRYEQELLRARRREHEIAQQLQRSLLSGALPAAAGLDVQAQYVPGEAGLEVGGDWYDAFWLEPEVSVGLVVGDVVGRGIEAAATMGQLRSAVRALASTGLGPGELLGGLDRYARRHAVGDMTTLVYAQLDLPSGELRYACAGHPPPVLVVADRAPVLLWEGRSPPLATQAGAGRDRAEARAQLAPGCCVLLYTDGLVERRSAPITENLARLADHVAARSGDSAADLARGTVDAFGDRDHADDVCVLVARRGEGRGGR